jgi:hypothetical protein
MLTAPALFFRDLMSVSTVFLWGFLGGGVLEATTLVAALARQAWAGPQWIHGFGLVAICLIGAIYAAIGGLFSVIVLSGSDAAPRAALLVGLAGASLIQQLTRTFAPPPMIRDTEPPNVRGPGFWAQIGAGMRWWDSARITAAGTVAVFVVALITLIVIWGHS